MINNSKDQRFEKAMDYATRNMSEALVIAFKYDPTLFKNEYAEFWAFIRGWDGRADAELEDKSTKELLGDGNG